MKKNRKKHSAQFKAQVALEAMREELTVVEIARRYKITRTLVHNWKKEAVERMALVFEPGHAHSTEAASAEREAELLRKVGQLTVENDFLARGLARVR